MSAGLCLVTKGMICVTEAALLISCDEPVMTSALEIRPRIRNVAAPPAAAVAIPVVTSAEELKPVMRDADAPPEPDPDPRPKPTVTIELKPVIKKAEED